MEWDFKVGMGAARTVFPYNSLEVSKLQLPGIPTLQGTYMTYPTVHGKAGNSSTQKWFGDWVWGYVIVKPGETIMEVLVDNLRNQNFGV